MLENIVNIGRKLDFNVNTIESFLNSTAQRFMCFYTVPEEMLHGIFFLSECNC